ncbi:sugar nucleotidyltransferase [Halobacteriales archaeon Cl-PHB]
MKGVVLAGGRGTRLRPMTQVVNKHVLPIYDEPMIFYPVRTLVESGIDEILVISNADHIGKYIQLLEEEFDAEFSYRVQKEPAGIAHAVSLAEGFADEEIAVILGDNILLGDVTEDINSFTKADNKAKIFLKHVNEPSAYGVASVNDGKVVKLEEKPTSPDSDHAVIGLYLYEANVFDHIAELDPSDRGEYEITDLNKRYVERNALEYSEFDGEWFDAGTPEGMYQASHTVRAQKEE